VRFGFAENLGELRRDEVVFGRDLEQRFGGVPLAQRFGSFGVRRTNLVALLGSLFAARNGQRRSGCICVEPLSARGAAKIAKALAMKADARRAQRIDRCAAAGAG